MKNKIDKNFFLSSFFSSMPGVVSILLSFLSIPIYLKYGGKEEYGNYLFLHFFSFVGTVLNFGLGKISAINISKNKEKDKTALVLLYKTIKNSFIVLIIFFFLSISSNFILTILTKKILLLILGIFFTVLFITIEGIFQGKKLFFMLMFVNLFFYGISLSLPPFLLIFYQLNNENLFIVSLIIKLFIIMISLYYLFRHKRFFFFKYSSLSTYPQQKWFILSSLLNIIYDLLDKYLIKFYISPLALAVYSIPQQIVGKLSIFSKAISAVLLPNIAQKKNKIITKDFALSLKVFIFVIPPFILLFLIFSEFFFKIWLGEDSSIEIINLAKVFSIATWVSCLSHLIISYYEANDIIKKNSILELIFFPFFLIILYFAILTKNLLVFSYVILIKEILLFFFRSVKLSKEITIIKYSYILIIIYLYILFYLLN